MNQTLIERFRRLPKLPITCQGGVFQLPFRVREAGIAPFQPHLPMWAELETRFVHGGDMILPGDDHYCAALEALGEFIDRLLQGRGCPGRLEVSDPGLADYLRERLGSAGIDVQRVARLPMLEGYISEMAAMLGGGVKQPPGLIEARGVRTERIRAFADAAKEFYRAALWRYLTDVDLIQIESPKPPRAMTCLVVLGAANDTYGLGMYSSRTAFNRFLRSAESGDFGPHLAAGLSHLIYGPLDELPPRDALLWTDRDLPVANDQAYPFIMKYDRQGAGSRPTAKELTFLEGVLRALAATSETEIDSGRWSHEVVTFDGRADFTLAMPDLLDPPSPAEWLQRGMMPDRRAHERVFADMHRMINARSPMGEQELEDLQSLFAGRSLDDPVSRPDTPSELAQELCFQAFDTMGRRRVQLARQALEVDPDCADAHVILAEQSGALEDQIQHYDQGMRAAERALGKEFFRDNAGHFWGISQSRPYMRARMGLAESLLAAGETDKAIKHFEELLRLNPQDNQGVRYVLLPNLIVAGRDADAWKLLKKYDEASAMWAYARAVLAFRAEGQSANADAELRNAYRTNPDVPKFLRLGASPPLPPFYEPGSFEEACVVAQRIREAVEVTPGGKQWFTRRFDEASGPGHRHARPTDRSKGFKGKKRRK